MSLFVDSKLINEQGRKDLRMKHSLSSSRFCKFFLLSLSIFASLPIVFFWPVGSSCRLYCCLGNRRFRYLLASILLGDLDLQMVCHVLIRVGHACTHGSQIASLW